MKKVTIILALMFSINAHSQTSRSSSIKVDSNGNYVQSVNTELHLDSLTDKTLTLKDGSVYPIYESPRGKLYVVRKSMKSGNYYKYYLNLTKDIQ